MYIPIIKNRNQEKKVIRDFQQYLNDDVVPLFEVIKDDYKERFQKDPETGKFVMIMPEDGKRRKKVKLPRREEDIKTLSVLNEILNGKKAFVEFFRYIDEEYKGVKVDTNKVDLSFALSRDYNLYKKRMVDIRNFDNLIPTISIKKGFEFSKTDLNSIISDLKMNNAPIAIRITDDLFEDYSEQLSRYLTKIDYIMLDVREQNIESKIMELEEFEEFETDASKILLNSPRSRKRKNGDYEHLQFTDKIDNTCAINYSSYNFDGFGDFGGLKDTLPSKGGGGGKGCALALMYSKEYNNFFSIVNYDVDQGLRGYRTVVADLLENRSLIDLNYDCPIIDEIEEKANEGSYGNWENWTYYTLARYIYQLVVK